MGVARYRGTVDRQADRSIRVTIRELRDPAGLQHTFRADGVSASVTFTGQRNPACQGYPGGRGSWRGRRNGSPGRGPAFLWLPASGGPGQPHRQWLAIHGQSCLYSQRAGQERVPD